MGSNPSRSRNQPAAGRRSSVPRTNAAWVRPRRRHSFSGDVGRRPARRDPSTDERRTPTPPPVDDQLKVLSVDFRQLSNKRLHYTYEMDEVDGLIVRRGQAFEVHLQLSRPYNKDTDVVALNFQTGDTKSFQKRTRVLVTLGESRSILAILAGGWTAEIDEEEESTLKVSVTAAPNALVGRYSLTVRTDVKSDDSSTATHFFKEPGPIFLLFNAWCENDQVYLEKKEEREEFVMNEKGLIWYGNTRQLAKRTWNFSQFEKGVFEAVMYLLSTHVGEFDRWSPVKVSRVMSAAVNSQDDNGVLSGRWDGKYSPYSKPTSWTGSQAILEKHLETKAPVRYGQCWVFSGVLTTVLRCLGIPTRSVTNFASAHDTDNSLTIDRFFDENNERLEKYESDSIWNFHVWNEAWMSRPELPPGYGGWQAVDATPQEKSEGVYCAGPCPVSAIKQGQVYYPYDAEFIFAEVNGDIINWLMKKDGTTEVMSMKTKSVGRYISTKAVGSKERLDLTLEYKHPEGSDAERAAVKSATDFGSRPFVHDKPNTTEDVEMSLQCQDLYIGADFDITVPLVNKSQEDRTVAVTVIVQVVYYTGVLAGKIKKCNENIQLGPGLEYKLPIHVDADEYLDKLVDQSAFKVFLLGHVEETGQAYADEEDFRMRTHDFDEVKLLQPAANEVRVGQPVKVELSLTNPLKKTLTNCEIAIEGPGLLPPRVIKLRNVDPGQKRIHTEEFRPRKSGERTLVATFESDQLTQSTGELDLNVLKVE